MKPLSIIFFLLSLFTSGCTTLPSTQVEAAPESKCKIVLAKPGQINNDGSKQTDLEKSEARAALATSDLRRAQLARPEGLSGTIEQALDDCK